MRRFVRGILHPEAFHGEGAPAPFFEGWYLKLVTADQRRSLALIPGLFRGREPGSAHAFVQVVIPGAEAVRFERVPVEAFSAADDEFDVRVGASRFGARGVRVDLPGCRGEVGFGELAPWPVTPTAPGVMGWYAWVPVMQCYHGVVSLDHTLSGQLELDGEVLDFDGGRGYIEKDWGRSFPKRWVWMQSNHFDEPGICASLSVADVPWLGGAFPGFLVGFWRKGRLLRLTTYTGAKVTRVERTADGAALEVEDARHRLTAFAGGGTPVRIHMPSERSMEGVVEEHLGATLEIRLVEKGPSESVLFEGLGRQAAYEVQGDVRKLRRRAPFSREEI